MKVYFFIVFIAFLILAGCSSDKKYDYVFEDQLYVCMVNGFNSKDYDLNKNLAELKTLLQENQVLTGTTGKDFDKFFTKIATEDWGDLGITEQTTSALSALVVADDSYWCSLETMGLDSAQFKSSKFAAIMEQFNEDYPVVDGAYKVFNGQEFATFYGKVLSEEDLEHKYYQYLAINGFAYYFLEEQE